MTTQDTSGVDALENETAQEHSAWKSDSGPLHAHWDCFSGAAGDMMLASCLDSVDVNKRPALLHHIQKCLEKGLPELEGEFRIEMKRVWRGGMGSIAATHVSVHSSYGHEPAPVPTPAVEKTPEANAGHSHDHNHSHDYSHSHGHGHLHEHSDHDGKINEAGLNSESQSDGHCHAHGHSRTNSRGPLRNWPQIRKMLLDAPTDYIPTWVRDVALEAFQTLATAEAETHGASSADAVHFHEVGAIDSIVDTVGTLLALHALRVETVSCSRLPLGQGTVWTNHGLLPVPAPATLRLMVGMPTCPGPPGITGELVTPTAAALLRVLTKKNIKAGQPPCFTLRRVGIGAGTKDFEKHPNILRLMLGDEVVHDGRLKS